jgi:hypothetical protein
MQLMLEYLKAVRRSHSFRIRGDPPISPCSRNERQAPVGQYDE